MTATNASASGQYVEPPLHFNMTAKVSEATTIHVATTSLPELGRICALFNLVPDGTTPVDKPTPTETAEPKRRKTDPKGSPETTAASTAASPAPSPSQAAAPVSAPAPTAPASSSASAIQAEAAAAVRAYGARTSIDAARELLKKHGFTKTGEITADKAAAIIADATAEDL